MKNTKLRALRTLARIRLRRQEALDRHRVQEQLALASLVDAAQEKSEAVAAAKQDVINQIEKIAQLLVSGNRFQVADYLGQQDYQAWLQAKVVTAQSKQTEAQAAVTRQEEVLHQARVACARNRDRCKRLDDSIRQIGIDIDVAQMDSDDEEAEEATVNRRKLASHRMGGEIEEAGRTGEAQESTIDLSEPVIANQSSTSDGRTCRESRIHD